MIQGFFGWLCIAASEKIDSHVIFLRPGVKREMRLGKKKKSGQALWFEFVKTGFQDPETSFPDRPRKKFSGKRY
jgi:hypothetical protein